MTGPNTAVLRAAADPSSVLREAYEALHAENRRVACQPSGHPSEHACQFPSLPFLILLDVFSRNRSQPGPGHLRWGLAAVVNLLW